MRLLRRPFIAALAAAMLSGCSSPFEASDHVEARFRNATPFTLTDVSLSWPGGSMHVDALAPGASSAFERHDGAYSYGALAVTMNGTVRRLQPTDYVGESPLAAGLYTYVISTSTYSPDGIELQLERALPIGARYSDSTRNLSTPRLSSSTTVRRSPLGTFKAPVVASFAPPPGAVTNTSHAPGSL